VGGSVFIALVLVSLALESFIKTRREGEERPYIDFERILPVTEVTIICIYLLNE